MLGDFIGIKEVGCNLFEPGPGPKVFGVGTGSKGIGSQGDSSTAI